MAPRAGAGRGAAKRKAALDDNREAVGDMVEHQIRKLQERRFADLNVFERALLKSWALWEWAKEDETSLMLFTPGNPIRKSVWKVLNWKRFEQIVLFLIAINCVTLALFDPMQAPDEGRNAFLSQCELIFTFVFSVEFMMQIIARGFLFQKGSYLSNPWYVMDFIVVCSGFVSLLPGAGNVTGLRTLRALKPLKTINGVPGMRVLVATLLESIPLLMDVLVLLAWLFFIFGIVSVQQWGGKLRGRCAYATTLEVDPSQSNFPCGARICAEGLVCIQTALEPNFGITSFNNMMLASLNIYQAMTLQGWVDIMYATNAGGGQEFSIFFWLMLVIIGSFFALSLMTAVISAKFSQLQTLENRQGSRREKGPLQILREFVVQKPLWRARVLRYEAFLDEEWPWQPPLRKFVTGYRSKTPYEDAEREQRAWEAENGFANDPKEVIMDPEWGPSKWFNGFIIACIFLNTSTMAAEHHNMDPGAKSTLEQINLVLTIIFALEMLIKLAALGVVEYLGDTFNRFDGFIVSISLVELVSSSSGVSVLRSFRLLRVLRSMKILKAHKGVKKLMETVVKGFAALTDFMLLLLLFIFIFAVLGMQLFGGRPEFQGSRKNFDSFWDSFLSVFEMLTGANWFVVMWDSMRATSWALSIYHVFWILLGNFTLLNLFLAILIENFAAESEEEQLEREEEEAKDRAVKERRQGKQQANIQHRITRRNQRKFADSSAKIKRWLRDIGEEYKANSGSESSDGGGDESDGGDDGLEDDLQGPVNRGAAGDVEVDITSIAHKLILTGTAGASRNPFQRDRGDDGFLRGTSWTEGGEGGRHPGEDQSVYSTTQLSKLKNVIGKMWGKGAVGETEDAQGFRAPPKTASRWGALKGHVQTGKLSGAETGEGTARSGASGAGSGAGVGGGPQVAGPAASEGKNVRWAQAMRGIKAMRILSGAVGTSSQKRRVEADKKAGDHREAGSGNYEATLAMRAAEQVEMANRGGGHFQGSPVGSESGSPREQVVVNEAPPPGFGGTLARVSTLDKRKNQSFAGIVGSGGGGGPPGMGLKSATSRALGGAGHVGEAAPHPSSFAPAAAEGPPKPIDSRVDAKSAGSRSSVGASLQRAASRGSGASTSQLEIKEVPKTGDPSLDAFNTLLGRRPSGALSSGAAAGGGGRGGGAVSSLLRDLGSQRSLNVVHEGAAQEAGGGRGVAASPAGFLGGLATRGASTRGLGASSGAGGAASALPTLKGPGGRAPAGGAAAAAMRPRANPLQAILAGGQQGGASTPAASSDSPVAPSPAATRVGPSPGALGGGRMAFPGGGRVGGSDAGSAAPTGPSPSGGSGAGGLVSALKGRAADHFAMTPGASTTPGGGNSRRTSFQDPPGAGAQGRRTSSQELVGTPTPGSRRPSFMDAQPEAGASRDSRRVSYQEQSGVPTPKGALKTPSSSSPGMGARKQSSQVGFSPGGGDGGGGPVVEGVSASAYVAGHADAAVARHGRRARRGEGVGPMVSTSSAGYRAAPSSSSSFAARPAAMEGAGGGGGEEDEGDDDDDLPPGFGGSARADLGAPPGHAGAGAWEGEEGGGARRGPPAGRRRRRSARRALSMPPPPAPASHPPAPPPPAPPAAAGEIQPCSDSEDGSSRGGGWGAGSPVASPGGEGWPWQGAGANARAYLQLADDDDDEEDDAGYVSSPDAAPFSYADAYAAGAAFGSDAEAAEHGTDDGTDDGTDEEIVVVRGGYGRGHGGGGGYASEGDAWLGQGAHVGGGGGGGGGRGAGEAVVEGFGGQGPPGACSGGRRAASSRGSSRGSRNGRGAERYRVHRDEIQSEEDLYRTGAPPSRPGRGGGGGGWEGAGAPDGSPTRTGISRTGSLGAANPFGVEIRVRRNPQAAAAVASPSSRRRAEARLARAPSGGGLVQPPAPAALRSALRGGAAAPRGGGAGAATAGLVGGGDTSGLPPPYHPGRPLGFTTTASGRPDSGGPITEGSGGGWGKLKPGGGGPDDGLAAPLLGPGSTMGGMEDGVAPRTGSMTGSVTSAGGTPSPARRGSLGGASSLSARRSSFKEPPGLSPNKPKMGGLLSVLSRFKGSTDAESPGSGGPGGDLVTGSHMLGGVGAMSRTRSIASRGSYGGTDRDTDDEFDEEDELLQQLRMKVQQRRLDDIKLRPVTDNFELDVTMTNDLVMPVVGYSAGTMVGARASGKGGIPGREPVLSCHDAKPLPKKQRNNSKPQLDLTPPKDRPTYMKYSSLYIVSPSSVFRRLMFRVAFDPKFEWTVLFLIFCSSMSLALDSPNLDPESSLAEALRYMDVVFNVAFTIECVVKVVVMGFVMHPGAYLRSTWNQLDFFIVTTSLMGVFLNDPRLAIVRSFRLLRALRPLRMISRLKGMQLVVTALIKAIPAVMNVVMFGFLIFLIFGILGVQLFGGKFYSCNDGNVRWRRECVGTFLDESGVWTRREWRNPILHFDDIMQAMLSLFVIASGDNWMSLAYSAMDITSIDQQPKKDNHREYFVFFFVFVVLGSFFWVNLLVGVIIDYYSRIQAESGGLNLQTDAQKDWAQAMRLKKYANVQLDKADLPSNFIRRNLWILVVNNWFEAFIMLCICCNIMFMAIQHDGQDPIYDDLQQSSNIIFSYIFMMEMACKMLAFLPKKYFSEWWNRFDFLICLGSIPTLLGINVGPGSTIFRVFRIGRMFRLVQGARGLRALFNTFILSMPAMANVGSLLFLLMFVYGVLGMSMFGEIEVGLTGGINENNNFWTFSSSLLVMFRVFTGDSWSNVLMDAMECDFTDLETCQFTLVPPAFLSSFIVIGNFVMLNLIIGVILDQFLDSARTEGLLSTATFFDTLQRKMLLDDFVNRLKALLDAQKLKKRHLKSGKR